MQAKSAFKGVFIPALILRDPRLSAKEKILLAYVKGLPRFFASNGHLAETLGWPKKTVANLLTSLKVKTGLKRERFPKSGKNRGSNVPETGNQTFPKLGIIVPETGNVSIGREESLELSKKKALEESRTYPNQGMYSTMNPNPKESPATPPVELPDEPFESDPNIVRRVKTPEEEFEEMEALERLKERDRLRRLTRIA